MKRSLLLVTLFLCSCAALAQQQRLIVVGGAAWFPFDPVSGRYEAGSLAQTVNYIEAWREELGEENVFVSLASTFQANTPKGYRAVMAVTDSLLFEKIKSYLDVTPLDTVKFSMRNQKPDTLQKGRILVVDRWDFLGDVSTAYKVADVSDMPQSKLYLNFFDKDIQRLKHTLSTPLIELDTVYSTRDSYFGPSRLAGLFHAFQSDVSNADLSLFAPPRMDMTWVQGGLYVKDVVNMMPFDNELSVATVSGVQILEFLEEVYGGRYYTMKRPTDDLVRLKTPYFYHESAVGLEYTVNVNKPKGKRIENHNIDLTRTYTVAINSFRVKWFLERGCSVKNAGDYRLLFLHWLASNSDAAKCSAHMERWKIIPERWVSDAALRERNSLFD